MCGPRTRNCSLAKRRCRSKAEVPFQTAELTPMARSFYGESKRVRNDRIKVDLGVRLAYPTYREGLAAIAAEP